MPFVRRWISPNIVANKGCRCFPVHYAFYVALKSHANICIFCGRVANLECMACYVSAKFEPSQLTFVHLDIRSAGPYCFVEEEMKSLGLRMHTYCKVHLTWNSVPICSCSHLICVNCGRCRWRLQISRRFYRIARPTLSYSRRIPTSPSNAALPLPNI